MTANRSFSIDHFSKSHIRLILSEELRKEGELESIHNCNSGADNL